MRKTILFAALVAVSGLAQADQLIVTGEKASKGTAIALDYASDGKASGFQFRIAVPGGENAKVDLSRCLKALPKSHAGQCSFAKGMVIGVAYSDNNELLPAGVLTLGTVAVKGAAVGKPQVVQFLAADASGNDIGTSVELGSDAVEKNLSK